MLNDLFNKMRSSYAMQIRQADANRLLFKLCESKFETYFGMKRNFGLKNLSSQKRLSQPLNSIALLN